MRKKTNESYIGGKIGGQKARGYLSSICSNDEVTLNSCLALDETDSYPRLSGFSENRMKQTLYIYIYITENNKHM